MKCLIVVHSYHHGNSAKIARVFAQVLTAQFASPINKGRLNAKDLKHAEEFASRLKKQL